MYDINLIIFFVFAILYFLGIYGGAYLLIIGAGVLIIGNATSLTLFSTPALNIVFAILIALFSIYHGILLIRKEKKNNV